MSSVENDSSKSEQTAASFWESLSSVATAALPIEDNAIRMNIVDVFEKLFIIFVGGGTFKHFDEIRQITGGTWVDKHFGPFIRLLFHGCE